MERERGREGQGERKGRVTWPANTQFYSDCMTTAR